MGLPGLQFSEHVFPRLFSSPKRDFSFVFPNETTLCRFSSGSWAPLNLFKSGSLIKFASRGRTMKRACFLNFEEFSRRDLSNLLLEIRQILDEVEEGDNNELLSNNSITCAVPMSKFQPLKPRVLGIKPEPPEWPEREEIVREIIERRLNSLDFPLSLRMIKKRRKSQENCLGNLGDPISCSVKRAFSSVVNIILELQNCALKMRERIEYDDLEDIMDRVHREMHGSFAWLFQGVFSKTPALMISVMTLLADFSVSSVSVYNQYVLLLGMEGTSQDQFDSSSIELLSRNSCENEKVEEKGLQLWSLVVDEAIGMREESSRAGVVKNDEAPSFVPPFSVEIEPDDCVEFHRTDLRYQTCLSENPNDPLLLCNYAQFLQLVTHDYDRAEKCYKRAIQADPSNAEALSLYANFLWVVRKDFWGAEERYLEALAVEPSNPFYASKYATFLWSTGGVDTWLPLS
ncbi:hypothetical protein NMG60_11018405 [Bertholletia excelsa]